jgi:D-sedoheptulose 7-phosphate isomerase
MNPIVQQQYQQLVQAVADAQASLAAVDHCAQVIADALLAGKKVLAADALHLCEELVGRYKDNRRALPAVSLAADGAALTCIGNDFGFDRIFARQVEALGAPGDVLVLFTTSGNSPNLLLALEAAKAGNLATVTLAGRGGGKLAGRADAEWIVSSQNGARVQELHSWALHVILEVVEDRLLT